MTQTTDGVEIEDAIVVTLDICSSSMLIEDLLKNDRSKLWRDLIISTKDYLMAQAPRYNAEVHKFIGDGWLIFFRQPYSGKGLLEFLSDVYAHFTQLYEETVVSSLDTPPEIAGLTFGIDEGRLIKVEMRDQIEFIGRPINIACRLQGKIEKDDIENGFRVLMSNRLFNDLKADLKDCYHLVTTKQLKNIGDGKHFTCYLISIDKGFRLISVFYGTSPDDEVDVTSQYAKQIRNNRLNVKVNNTIAECDPAPNERKVLSVKYSWQGVINQIMVEEKSWLEIP